MRSRILAIVGLLVVAGAGAAVATRVVRARRRSLATAAQETAWWWLSYVDPDLPRGQRFRGVVIIDGELESVAVLRAAERGLAPPGNVRATRLDPDSIAVRDHRYRLLSRAQLAAARLI